MSETTEHTKRLLLLLWEAAKDDTTALRHLKSAAVRCQHYELATKIREEMNKIQNQQI